MHILIQRAIQWFILLLTTALASEGLEAIGRHMIVPHRILPTTDLIVELIASSTAQHRRSPG